MAVTATHILTAGTTADATSYNTASVNLSAGKLVLIAVYSAYTGGTVNIPTVTGASRTWTQVVTKVDVDNWRRGSTKFKTFRS